MQFVCHEPGDELVGGFGDDGKASLGVFIAPIQAHARQEACQVAFRMEGRHGAEARGVQGF